MHHPLLFQAAIAFGMLAMAAAGFLLFVVVPVLTIIITVVLTKRRMTATQAPMTFVLWLKHIAIGLGCSLVFVAFVAKVLWWLCSRIVFM